MKRGAPSKSLNNCFQQEVQNSAAAPTNIAYYKPKALQMIRYTCIKRVFLFCNAKLLSVICALQVTFLFVYSLVLVLLKSSNRSLVSIFNSEFNHFFLKQLLKVFHQLIPLETTDTCLLHFLVTGEHQTSCFSIAIFQQLGYSLGAPTSCISRDFPETSYQSKPQWYSDGRTIDIVLKK